MATNVFLEQILNDEIVIKLLNKIKLLSTKTEVFPDFKNIFKAFELAKLDETKVVIFGQDPYYQPGVADGLAFSTKQSKTPASLNNIFKELKREYHNLDSETNDLSAWAKQGVLLLNTTLTVEKNKPNSHYDLGWSYVIEKAIQYLNNKRLNVVFLLWGNHAKKLRPLIDETKHYVLVSSHPSPLSVNYGFLGNNHFWDTNEYLIKKGQKPINWNLKKG